MLLGTEIELSDKAENVDVHVQNDVSRNVVSLCSRGTMRIGILALCLLIMAPPMINDGFLKYNSYLSNFKYMLIVQEQIFYPPLNQSSFYGYSPCELLTYSYGTVLSNQQIVTFNVSGQCPTNYLPCESWFLSALPIGQTLYYDVRNPIGTITRDSYAYNQIDINKSSGIMSLSLGFLFLLGEVALFIVFIMRCRRYFKEPIHNRVSFKY
ncbi:MAG: hypothetical protein Sylvanvirus14_3 [Sylvanvirus sp.]|uniref:Uncharacterized protein n=1 Tax=Sylvanvirus sp. TaxID=2487774 RepID=A0A3G5AID4_9VIRU|nr:MAG: hypothetical protein Sylvanvirus14_3 [Sylvanvirus sp.]